MARILIVEDMADATDAIEEMLRDAGHEVTTVPNGRRALTHVLDRLPDVVLLDLMMPEMDGPTFLEVVRSYLRLQSLPVVVLTGLGDSALIERARKLNVNAILMKGQANLEDIQLAIESAIPPANG